MLKQSHFLIGLVGVVAACGFCLFPPAIAQTTAPAPASGPATTGVFQGRGVAQGAAFTRGRNANLNLTLDGENYSLELTEILASNVRNQTPARVQYRGAITRRTDEPGAANSFSVFTRVRSFDTSDNLRIITNTTGTCRIDVFDARVISSSCNTASSNSSTHFLGLEQF